MRRFTKNIVLLAAILAVICTVAGCEATKSAIASISSHPEHQRLSRVERELVAAQPERQRVVQPERQRVVQPERQRVVQPERQRVVQPERHGNTYQPGIRD